MPSYMGIENLTNIRAGEDRNVILADMERDGEILTIEYRVRVKNTWDVILEVIIDGIRWNDFVSTSEIRDFWFELNELEFNNRNRKHRDARIRVTRLLGATE